MNDLEDRDGVMEQIAQKYNEMSGRLVASSADSHPFIQSLFLLKLAVGMFAFMVIAEPIFVSISLDALTMQLAMFVVQILLAFAVFAQAHSARVEEIYIAIRASGYGASQRPCSWLPAATFLFSGVVLSKLVASIVAARIGELSFDAMIALTIFSVVFLTGVIGCIERYKNFYIINDL